MSHSSFLFTAAIAAVGATIAMGSGERGIAAGRPQVLMRIKPGLWDFETKSKVSGDTVIANAISARLPPAQL